MPPTAASATPRRFRDRAFPYVESPYTEFTGGIAARIIAALPFLPQHGGRYPKEGTVAILVPYEVFLMRRLQQAQRRETGSIPDPSGCVVVKLVRRRKRVVRSSGASRTDHRFR